MKMKRTVHKMSLGPKQSAGKRVAPDACRLCLEPAAETCLFTGSVTLQKKAISCLDIQVEPDDGLPPGVCHKCEINLNNFYDFRINCQLINKQLRSHRNQLPIKNTFDSDTDIDFKKIEIILNINNSCEDWLVQDTKPILNNLNLDNTTVKLEPLDNASDKQGSGFEISTSKNSNESKPLQTRIEKLQSRRQDSIPAQCEICGKIFKHKTALKKHIVSHTGIKSYSCKICNKTFTRLEHERVHMRAHKGIRPFICEVCARAFTKRQDLVRHMKVHSDEKRHPCPRCNRLFKRSADVRSHMKSHTGLRPYSCSSCDKSYTSHGGLKKHILAHCKLATVVYNNCAKSTLDTPEQQHSETKAVVAAL